MREYVVVAYNEPAIDSLHADLVNSTRNKPNIPNRKVEVADARELNQRITHYYLSDDEAATLQKDSRVQAVHLHPSREMAKPFFGKMLGATETPIAFNSTRGNFNRTAGTADLYNVNWGLRRTNIAAPELTAGSSYKYDEDGTGVDIIIMDDGVQVNHPEFLDTNGNSRVQQINWYATSPTPNLALPTGFYDLSITGEGEHGTHVAGIACGKTYGYAKGAKIYSMRIFDNTANGSKSFTNNIGVAFDLIKYWHNAKSIDPSTGYKRPTIVNMSWGYAWYYSGDPNNTMSKVINNITYRNVAHPYSNKVSYQTIYGQVGPMHGFIVPSIDAQIADGMAAGIIYISAAGNYSHKVDKSGGVDFNNFYKSSVYGVNPPNTATYYHRGSSPKGTIEVSAGDYVPVTVNGVLKEQLASYSERGPGCDIVSPGTYITSATSTLSTFNSFAYNFGTQLQSNSNKACKISGTSMSTPQVTGVCALHAARHPETKPAQMLSWVTNIAKKGIVNTTTSNNDWTNSRALLTGPNNYLYNPYQNGFID